MGLCCGHKPTGYQWNGGVGMSEMDEPPELGGLVNGRILVCHGDDWPEDFVAGLDHLVTEFITERDAP